MRARLLLLLLVGAALVACAAAQDQDQEREREREREQEDDNDDGSYRCALARHEREALVEFYYETDGPNWKRDDNWLRGSPCGIGAKGAQNWIGVLCGPCRDGGRGRIRHVEVLALEWNDLAGNLTDTVGDLEHLQVLNLGTNNLAGPLPRALGKARNMRVIKLSYNRLEGKYPEEWYRMSQLEMLDMPYNDVVGDMNGIWRSYPRMRKLNLRGNRGFAGDIGAAADSLARMARLRIMDLHWNTVGGELPASLFSLQELEELVLSSNSISGTLPDVINAPALSTLVLTKNYISGTVPAALGALTGLVTLELDRNFLSGHLPDPLSGLTSLETLKLAENLLTGPLPESLFALPQLTKLDLSNNEFFTHLPEQVGGLSKLTELVMHSCRLTGTIPESIGQLVALQKLQLQNNGFTGAIPATIGELTNLQHLSLARNRLAGSVPASIGKLHNLQHLHLHQNRLEHLPDTIGDCHRLTKLFLHMNRFSQPLPDIIGYLTLLDRLTLHSNKFTGERLPDSFGNLINLVEITAHDNLLDDKPYPRIDNSRDNPVTDHPFCENVNDRDGRRLHSYFRVCGTRNDFYVDTFLNETLMGRHNWSETHAEAFSACYGKCKKSAVYDEHMEFQRVSRYEDMYEVADKARFAHHVRRSFIRVGHREFDFHPPTFHMPYEYDEWKKENDKHPDGFWLLKPTISCCGQNIRMISGPDDPTMPTDLGNWIIQRFVHPPMIVKAHKFVLRQFVIVTSFSPLRVYFFPDGDVFYTHHKYSLDPKRLHRRGYFITDYFFTKKQRHLFTTSNHLFHYLKQQGVDTDAIYRSIQDVVVKALLVAEPRLRHQEQYYDEQRRAIYEVLGYDIVIDADHKPWVNTTPNLGLEINRAGDPIIHEEDFELKRRLHLHTLEMVGALPVRPGVLPDQLCSGDVCVANDGEDACERLVDTKLTSMGIHPSESVFCPDHSEPHECLSENDIQLLKDFECEYLRRGDFDLFFPADNADKYLPLFPVRRRENYVLAWWHRMRPPVRRDYPTAWSTPHTQYFRDLTASWNQTQWMRFVWSKNVPTTSWNTDEEGEIPVPDRDRHVLHDEDQFDADEEEDSGAGATALHEPLPSTARDTETMTFNAFGEAENDEAFVGASRIGGYGDGDDGDDGDGDGDGDFGELDSPEQHSVANPLSAPVTPSGPALNPLSSKDTNVPTTTSTPDPSSDPIASSNNNDNNDNDDNHNDDEEEIPESELSYASGWTMFVGDNFDETEYDRDPDAYAQRYMQSHGDHVQPAELMEQLERKAAATGTEHQRD